MKYRITSLALSLIGSASAYTLHEWGTFTSVSGSDGQLLSGLDREEEKLPPFIEALDGMQNIGPSAFGYKGYSLLRPLRNVTIKMETPVIYFYSDQAFDAKVEIGFQGGAISQWYPSRSSGETPPAIAQKKTTIITDPEKLFIAQGGIDFATQRQGSIAWDLKVLAPDASRGLTFKPGETLNWLRPKNPKANILKVGEQYEDYLFYRGVGNFDLPVTFRVDASETLHLENTGDETIPFLFVQEVTPEGIRFFTMHDGLAQEKTKSIAEADFTTPGKNWQRPVYEAMEKGLLASGLTPEETHGMIQTWWHSYFQAPGLRVFWIVPEKKTNAILPLTVTPAPEETVRVLVGRSEILRPRFERIMMAHYKDRADKEKSMNWYRLSSSRYGKAYTQLVNDKVTLTSEN